MDSVFSGMATGLDAHSFDFAHVADRHPWLIELESRAQNARIETLDDLHRALFYIHTVTAAYLPHPACITADLHLGRLLDDSAALHWREVVE